MDNNLCQQSKYLFLAQELSSVLKTLKVSANPAVPKDTLKIDAVVSACTIDTCRIHPLHPPLP